MLNELEKESLLIKELIISQEKYEKLNFVLNQDLKFQKEIQKELVSKNIKYLNIIKSIQMKYPNDVIINEDILKEKPSLSEKKKEKIKKLRLKYWSKDESENIKEKQEQITKNIIKNNLYRECKTNKNYPYDKINEKYFDEYISLRKLNEELYR
jgi:hypothetical protein